MRIIRKKSADKSTCSTAMQGPQMEKPQGLRRQKLERKLLLKREKKKHVLLIQNVNFNVGKVSNVAFAGDLKEPSSDARTCRLAAYNTVRLFNRRNDSFYWLFRTARRANQPVTIAACYI